jgi:hypothetical protein
MKALIYVLLITTIILISFKQEQNSKKIFQQLNALQKARGEWKHPAVHCMKAGLIPMIL